MQFDALLGRVREIHTLIDPSIGFLSSQRVLNVCKNHPLVRLSADAMASSLPTFQISADRADDVEKTLVQDGDPSMQKIIQRFLPNQRPSEDNG